MKVTADYLRQLIKEETQGEVEFAELEAARQNYKENFRDDEARHQFGMMVEKLVEPIMSEMGLFLEAEAFYNRGELVFTNYKNIDVTIDPLGMMGRYDVQVTPLAGSEGEINPMEISLDSMKGVAQFIKDEYREQLSRGGTYKQPPRGMVGEPEAQTELPLEHKMRITKSQLQQVIREEIKEAARLSGRDMARRDMEFPEVYGSKMPDKAEIEEVLDDVLQDIRKHATSDAIAKQGARAEVLLSMLMGGRYAAEMYKDMFGDRGLTGYMDDRYGD